MTTPLNACEISILQIPTKDNGFHAVCIARVVSPAGQAFTAIGEAFGETDDLGQSSLQRAEQCARNKAIELMQNHAGQTSPDQPAPASGWEITSVKTKRPAGGAITDRQKRFIETTAMCNGKTLNDAEAISQKLYGRPISKLITTEVNPILDQLKL